MRAITRTLSAAGTSTAIPMDTYSDPFNVGVAVVMTGTLTYSVEHTFDDIFNSAVTPTWFANTGLSAKTTSSDGNYAYPVRAIRLNITSFTSGSATMTVIQAGMPGV